MKGKYNPNVHAALLAAVGGYLLYLAWQLLDTYRSQTGEMSPVINIAAVIIFVLGGIGTLYYAWSVYRHGKKTGGENEGDNDQRKN